MQFRYKLKSEYSNSTAFPTDDYSYLKHGNFKEKVILTINLNACKRVCGM